MAAYEQHEFSGNLNRIFISLGKGAIVCSIFLLAFALLNLFSLYRLVELAKPSIGFFINILVMATSLVASATMLRASRKLRQIAYTEGNDISLLQGGLQSLRVSVYSVAAMLGLLSVRYAYLLENIHKYYTMSQ